MIYIDGNHLTLEEFIQVSRDKKQVVVVNKAWENVKKSRDVVQARIDHKDIVYGINTGFGKLSDVRIAENDLSALQKNLLRSHACGSGEPFDVEVVRGMMLLRINALIKGYSGIRKQTIETLLTMLNENVIPVVYTQGSLGASGDLVPLAHMALPLIGEGDVFLEGKIVPAKNALISKSIDKLERLEAKEGLALINGTQAMASVGALTLYDAIQTFIYSGISAAMSFEALNGIIDVFDKRIHEARPHKGQCMTASLMRKILKGSKNVTHQGDDHVQDAYSLRTLPQVHGASYDAFSYVKTVLEIEMNSATDNPLIFTDTKEALSAGNFHGQPLAIAFDFLSIAISELANISERRLERLVNKDLNKKFPAFLAKEKGRNSGFMIVQYAAASLVSENKSLAHPASVDSIPSSGNQEDHVSMGTIAARKAAQIVKHTRKVVALEMFTAAQALDFNGANGCAPLTRQAYHKIRKGVPFIEEDTIMKPYMDYVETLLINNVIPITELEAFLWK